ncbi:hypothetical protein Rhal01_03470 [Rubritalea halochordaticola]|uniref:Uncharacterized protein n=1 Tax=Rubritalea halochordaticola TaxID=714537 RepID=A0ABP9V3P3_9BACT
MIHTLATWADAIPDEAVWLGLLLLLGLALFSLSCLMRWMYRKIRHKQRRQDQKKDQ